MHSLCMQTCDCNLQTGFMKADSDILHRIDTEV